MDGLAADTTYGWRMCVADQQEAPPRTVCSKAQSFSTASSEGMSGVAFTSDRDGDDEIFVMDADGANQTNLSNNAIFDDNQPSWSPDGQRIAFVSNRDGNREIYVMDADGGNPTRVTNNLQADHDPTWSPAGDRILFVRGEESTITRGSSIYGINPDGTNEQQRATPPLSDNEVFQYDPAWSPDAGGLAWGVFEFALNGGPTSCGDDSAGAWPLTIPVRAAFEGAGNDHVLPRPRLASVWTEASPSTVPRTCARQRPAISWRPGIRDKPGRRFPRLLVTRREQHRVRQQRRHLDHGRGW